MATADLIQGTNTESRTNVNESHNSNAIMIIVSGTTIVLQA